MRSMLSGDGHPEVFEEAYKNPEKPTDWDWVYEGYTAAVDWYVILSFFLLFILTNTSRKKNRLGRKNIYTF